MTFNKVIFVGRLTKDPVIVQGKNDTTFCGFSIAVGRFKKDETDFFDAIAFGTQAEFLVKNTHEGDLLLVEGRLQNELWADQDGTKRQKAKIFVNALELLCKKAPITESVQEGAVKKEEQEKQITDDIPF